MNRNLINPIAAIALLATGTAAAQERPIPVSPGAVNEAVMVDQRCPSFSWAGVEGAEGYELAVFALADGAEPMRVLKRTLPTGATSWTPSSAECLEAGGRYGWSIRVIGEKRSSEWSPVRLFALEALPSDEEVRQAMATLRRHLAGKRAPVSKGVASLASGDQYLPNEPAAALDNLESTRNRGDGWRALSTPTVAASPSPQSVTTPSSFSLNLSGDVELGGFVFKEGVPFVHTEGGYQWSNTAIGLRALASVTPGYPNPSFSGSENTAVGARALVYNTSGRRNTAVGVSALRNNITGKYNTAVGFTSLTGNTDGSYNTAVGYGALWLNTGSHNTAVGHRAMMYGDGYQNAAFGESALSANTSGSQNVALGRRALRSNTTGLNNVGVGYDALGDNEIGNKNIAVGTWALRNVSGYRNTALGHSAGYNLTAGSDNIFLGAPQGAAIESNTIRIGGATGTGTYDQNRTFISGIVGITTEVDDAIPVLIDSAGQLGTTSSSARVKEDIHDLDQASSPLFDLRPVSFRYRKPFKNGAKPTQFGLIAEEVAEVFPELVVYNTDGEPETVKYHLLSTLLLNEVKRQEQELAYLRGLGTEVVELRQQMADLRRRLEQLSKTR